MSLLDSFDSEQLSQVGPYAAGDVLSSVISRVQRCTMHMKVVRCWKFPDLIRSHRISIAWQSQVELRPGFDLAGSSSLLQGSEPRC